MSSAPLDGPGADDGEHVVVLDPQVRSVGTVEKLAAHVAPGTPHLAFSLVLLDGAGDVLVQRRAATKHHFAGAWANACCSHPRPGEPVRAAARRRATEELGVTIGLPEVRGGFWYRAEDPVSGLVEVEYDVVVRAEMDGVLRPDPREVAELRWVGSDQLGALAPVAPWFEQVMALALEAPGEVADGVLL